MSKNEKQIYRSALDFKRKNFPRAFAQNKNVINADPRALGASLARDSIERVKSLFK
ncbi:Uncharacterised protein [uncultured archaeon]|nr:Uncharacterised protein [uncultured archaeon]